MLEINLRQSWISTFLRCPEQARQERLGLVRQKETSDMLRGNAVHHAIEEAGAAKLQGREVDVEVMQDMAMRYIANHAPEVEEWRSELLDVQQTVEANIYTWYRELNPILFPRPDGIERMFIKSMGVRDIVPGWPSIKLNLVGTADWIDHSDVIWDWKNPSRHYEAWEKKRWDIQSHAYTWAHGLHKFNLAVMAKGKLQVIEIERSKEEHDAFIELCWSIVPTILSTADAWPQRWEGWHCSPKWCPVWQAGKCRGAHLGEDPWK